MCCKVAICSNGKSVLAVVLLFVTEFVKSSCFSTETVSGKSAAPADVLLKDAASDILLEVSVGLVANISDNVTDKNFFIKHHSFSLFV